MDRVVSLGPWHENNLKIREMKNQERMKLDLEKLISDVRGLKNDMKKIQLNINTLLVVNKTNLKKRRSE